MRRLLGVVLVASLLWAGWWAFGAWGARTAFAGWFEARRSAGWVADYADLSVAGFPNRFDITLTQPRLADPATGWAWEAPFFQVLALSYQPNHVIAVWPPDHALAAPDAKLRILSAKMQASLVLRAGPSLELDRMTMVADTLTLRAESGEEVSMTAFRSAVDRQDEGPARYRFGISTQDLSLPPGLRRLVGAADSLPQRFSALSVDLVAAFDKPWDRSAVEQARPQPVLIDLSLAQAKWGDLDIAMAGKVTVDAEGRPEGRITIKAQNWQQMLAMAETSGALAPRVADQAEGVLGMLARASGNPNSLDLPLDFARGLVFVGPIPVGPAPVIRLR